MLVLCTFVRPFLQVYPWQLCEWWYVCIVSVSDGERGTGGTQGREANGYITALREGPTNECNLLFLTKIKLPNLKRPVLHWVTLCIGNSD